MGRGFRRTAITTGRTVIAALIVCLCLCSCGGSSIEVQKVPKAEKPAGNFKPGEFAGAAFDAEQAEGNDEAQIDLSHTAQGYIGVLVNTDARVKLQVFKDREKYVYDVPLGTPQIFPLQCGDGTYVFKIMKNAKDIQYYEMYSCSAEVKLDSEFEPFLRPNQYCNYQEDSQCVRLARQMAKSASSEEDFVREVYDYICKNVEYDKAEAKHIPDDYLPDPDEILSSGKGICFDYASLGAAMLRSQGIPTKIVFGYVDPNDIYHAWNMFYTEETGWSTVEFEVNAGDWNRIDLTFSANGADGQFIGDGSHYTDMYYY